MEERNGKGTTLLLFSGSSLKRALSALGRYDFSRYSAKVVMNHEIQERVTALGRFGLFKFLALKHQRRNIWELMRSDVCRTEVD